MSPEDSGESAAVRRLVGPVGDPPTVQRWERVWRPFWVLPSVISLFAVLAGFLLPWLDENLGSRASWFFSGNAAAASAILSTIASAMVSITALVFSITMVVIQLASSQFTPRLLGDFLASRVTQVTLGIFTSSFVFAFLVLRRVRDGDDSFVPQFSVAVALALVLASVAMFFAFIHHVTVSIQVGQVIDRVATRTQAVLTRGWDEESAVAPAPAPAPEVPAVDGIVVTTGDRHGVVQDIALSVLASWAAEHGMRIDLLARPGLVRHTGQDLAVVHPVDQLAAGADEEATVEAVRAAFTLGRERLIDQDPEFGVRQLVDIGVRALSPGINDPTTAVEVLGELHRLLRVLACRLDPSPVIVDQAGTIRVVDQPTTFARVLDLSVDEIARYGKDSLQVPAEIELILADLAAIARPEHQRAIAAKR
ncbi:MAG: DUF2254 domain-containing protein [Phycicoccus sp.]|nr:DUF2254 domain-containing protein [Phycicoccus sp.]